MIIGTLMALETCQILGQISHNLLYKKTAYIQARSSLARSLEVNGKARQAEGEAKVVA